MRILFVIPSKEMGGTLSSLNNLTTLFGLVDKKYIFEILPLSDKGSFNEINNCKIYNAFFLSSTIIDKLEYQGDILRFIVKLIIKLIFKYIEPIKVSLLKIFFIHNRSWFNRYDYIVAFQEGFTTEFVSYIIHSKKFAWIHSDYLSYKSLLRVTKSEYKFYRKFDTLVCVSYSTKLSFLQCFPDLASKTVVINNLLDTRKIIDNSKSRIFDDRFSNKTFTILSIGRISPVKRFSEIPSIVSNLILKNIKFCWYIIGGGNDTKEIMKLKNEISKHNVDQYIKYLGEKKNPYKYIKKSDLVVCLSISESFNYVLSESMLLGTPVITTDFDSAYEFVRDGLEGSIVAFNELENSISSYMNDEEKQIKYRENCQKFEYNNSAILKKIINLFSK